MFVSPNMSIFFRSYCSGKLISLMAKVLLSTIFSNVFLISISEPGLRLGRHHWMLMFAPEPEWGACLSLTCSDGSGSSWEREPGDLTRRAVDHLHLPALPHCHWHWNRKEVNKWQDGHLESYLTYENLWTFKKPYWIEGVWIEYVFSIHLDFCHSGISYLFWTEFVVEVRVTYSHKLFV